MSDNRGWFQKFFDQCSFGPQYVIHLSVEQANSALNAFSGYDKKDWRTRGIIEALQRGIGSVTVVGEQRVVTINLGTSDVLRLKDVVHFDKSAVQSMVEDNGFVRTTTTYPK